MRPWQRIARDAGAILLGQLATIGFGVADTIMAGRYASTDLAALSIGMAIYVSLHVGLAGIVQALIPLVGQYHGARQPENVGTAFRQGVWLALIVSLPGAFVLSHPGPLLALARSTPDMEAQVRDYLGLLAWGLPLSLLFRCYSGLNQGISKPLLVTALQLVALVLKVPLNAWFIFGGAGLPPFGVVGCGLATVLIHAALLSFAAVMLKVHPIYRPFRLWTGWQWPQWAMQRELLRLGLPTGASYFFEVTAFTLMAVFISHFGTTPLAGHQIVANLASVMYMLPLSIAIATGARVAQLRGAGQAHEARRAGWQGIALAVGLAVLVGLGLYALRQPVLGIYTQDDAVHGAAASLFIYIALYQVFDAMQVAAAFALRSYRVALVPAVIYGIGLWGFGLGGGYALAFDLGGRVPAPLHGASGFWFGNAAALALVAVLLTSLYATVSRRGVQRAAG
jgi:MATE family multidrug resistance protein